MRPLPTALVPFFVAGLALYASAQEKPITTSKDNKDTLHVAVSGEVQLDYVWRSQEITGFINGFGPGPATSDATNTFEGFVAIRMDVDLNDKVSAVIEVGTKRVDGGFINTWAGTFANGVSLREARVLVNDFLTQGLKLGVGISDWTFDVRGQGNSFAFDPRHSQSFTRNLTTVQDTGLTLGNAPFELEPVGFWLSWSNQQIQLDLVALPAVIEGGSPRNDEALYAIDFWYKLDAGGMKGSRVGAIIAVDAVPGRNTDIFTLGGGADLKMMDGNLELFGEAYVQFGDAGTTGGGTTIPGDPAGETAKAHGYAFQIGFQYTIPNNPIWLGAKFDYLSGDKDAAPDKKVNNFLSYENINDLMILEDMYLGLDWDHNYWAFKINGGFALSVPPGKENFRIDGILGLTRTVKDVQFSAAVPGAPAEKKLGDEFDVTARWILTKQASLHLGLGYLFSSKILEDSMIQRGASTSKAKDKAIEYVLGADLKF